MLHVSCCTFVLLLEKYRCWASKTIIGLPIPGTGGAEFKSVTVASRGGRRGVFAVNDISEGEALV